MSCISSPEKKHDAWDQVVGVLLCGPRVQFRRQLLQAERDKSSSPSSSLFRQGSQVPCRSTAPHISPALDQRGGDGSAAVRSASLSALLTDLTGVTRRTASSRFAVSCRRRSKTTALSLQGKVVDSYLFESLSCPSRLFARNGDKEESQAVDHHACLDEI